MTKRSGQGNDGRGRQYHERTTGTPVQLDSEALHTSTWNKRTSRISQLRPTHVSCPNPPTSSPPTCAVLSLGILVGNQQPDRLTDCGACMAWFEHDTTTVLDKSHAQPPQKLMTEPNRITFEHSFVLRESRVRIPERGGQSRREEFVFDIQTPPRWYSEFKNICGFLHFVGLLRSISVSRRSLVFRSIHFVKSVVLPVRIHPHHRSTQITNLSQYSVS